ncbi:hypothetical protein [Bradyrhizobium sp. CCBAU 51745]|uniref:hypothetical protein n=1 Tax=Bradyrhizobium sp. CCBAU 51745 TaxID=1325099 RepID=UPI0023064CB9|nr:hypothetical protein [Bradyrhizobium sp. CCBAU 51745]
MTATRAKTSRSERHDRSWWRPRALRVEQKNARIAIVGSGHPLCAAVAASPRDLCSDGCRTSERSVSD